MRFTQLTIGARFEYQNERYSKVGPLTAVNLENNRQRMIPRSALVEPLQGTGEATPPSPPQEAPLDRARIVDAFEEYHRKCADLLADDEKHALDDAYQHFLVASGLK